MTFTDGSGSRLDDLLSREWLTTNHLGGYAASTIPSLNTRKYHGLLVAALAPPVHRMVLLSRVEEVVHCDGWPTPLACNEYPGTIHPDGHQSLHAFSPDPFPRWAYQGEGWTLGKTLQLLRGQNTVVLTYTLVGARRPIELELRPLLALRSIHDLMYQWNGCLEAEEKSAGHHRVPPTARTPEVFFAHDGVFANGEGVASWYFNTIYRLEQDRGYAGLEDLWCPGVIKWTLAPGETVHFVCSADPIELDRAVAATEVQAAQVDVPVVDSPLRDTDHDLLLRAAEKFLVDLPAEVIAKAPTCRVPMITKFPWSSPSVREALISLPGVLLVTGKTAIAKEMLLSLAARVRNGLIPTEFPEVGAEPVYGGADVSLWFINAVHHYLRYSGDEATAVRLFDTIVQILRAYQFGGSAGIVADPDGLLVCRSPGRGMTWMDAKAGDWVITPRAGRAVEINALWYNAIRIAAELAEHRVAPAQPNRCREMYELAARVQQSFNQRFWNVQTGCCCDVIDDHGSDPSIRPNQLLAISLPYPVLSPDRHVAVLERIRRDLLTPMGLRTLAPSDHGYQGRYAGDLVSRERACHNGSVHPWLLGAYVTAHVKVFGRSPKVRDDSRRLLKGCLMHLRADGLGNLPELFDGDSPHRPNGAIASATATGELLRCYVEDILDLSPWSTNTAAVAPSALAASLNVTVAPKVATKR